MDNLGISENEKEDHIHLYSHHPDINIISLAVFLK